MMHRELRIIALGLGGLLAVVALVFGFFRMG